MRVFYEDTETGEHLEVKTGDEKCPAFIHHANSWSTQLRLLWAAKHIGDGPWDYPTLVACTPPVMNGEHEMLCGDQRFYELPE